MFKGNAGTVDGVRIVLMDSIAQIDAEDEGAIVVSGSHGGRSAAEYALSVRLRLVCFNDAGVGKDDAGIVALRLLERQGVPAVAVSHESARIGDGRDAWESGVISRTNALAQQLGLRVRQRLGNIAEVSFL